MKTEWMLNRRSLRQLIMALAATMMMAVSVPAVESTNSNYRLRDDINSGGDESMSNSLYKMMGAVTAMDSSPMSGNFIIDPGLTNVIYFPNPIADLTIQPTGPNSAHLEWTHPNTGVSYTEPVVSYELRFSQAEITEQNFLFIPNPLAITRSGNLKQIYDLTLPSYDTKYHVGVVSIDSAGNKSFLHEPKEFWTFPNDPSDLSLVADHENKAVILMFNPNNPNTGHSLKFEAALYKQGQMPPALPESEVILENVQDNAPQTIVFDRDDKVKRQQAYAVFLRAYNGNNEHSNWVQAPGTVEIDKKLPTLKPIDQLSASGFIVSWNRNLVFGTYQAYVDSDSNFNLPIIKPIPRQNLSSQDFLGLKGNTRYYYKVKAWDIRGTGVGETTAESVVTHVLPPTNVFGTTISDTEAAVSWKKNVNNNSASHDYRVFVSTDTSFPATISKFKNIPFSGAEEMATTFDNLIPNGAYYVKIVGINQVGVEAQGSDIYVSASPVFHTKPVPVTLSVQSVADPTKEIAVQWNHDANEPAETLFVASLHGIDNCGGTPLQTVSFPAPQEPGIKTASFVSSLADPIYANAKYSVCVEVKSKTGLASNSALSIPLTAYTKPLPPQNLSPMPAIDSIDFSWTNFIGDASNQNSNQTDYQLSWVEFVGLLNPETNSATKAMNGTAHSLKPDVEYQAKVDALPILGSPWGRASTQTNAITLARPPSRERFGVFLTSAVIKWNSHDNPANTEYVPQLFLADGTELALSPIYLNLNEAKYESLTPNTTYFARVSAKNRGQVFTPYVEWDKKSTNPEKPLNIVLTRDAGDSSTKMILTWNPNNNPKTTRYEVLIDSDNNFNNPTQFSDVPAQLQGEETLKRYSIKGLTSNLAYYAKVEAHGHNGTVVVSGVSNEAETAPADVESISLEPVGDQTRELKLTWDKKGNSARTKYAVELTTNTTGPWTSYPLVTDVSEYRFTGLISNQQYIARVKVEGGNYSREQTNYTWPSAVVNLSSAAVGNGTHEVKFEWDPGNNAEATIYEVLLSTENGGNRREFPVRETVRGARSIVFGALEGVVWANEKYEVKVWVKPDNGNLTAPVQTASAWTEPLAVGSLVFPVISSHSIQAQWGEPVSMVNSVAVDNAPGTGYTLEWSTREGELQSWKSLAGGQGGYSEWLEPGAALTPDTTYYVDVRTKRRDNGVSTTFTRQAVVTNVSKPVLGRLDISPSTRSSVIRWERNSNPLDTMYEVTVYDGKKPMPPVIVRTTHTIVGGLTPAKAYEFTVTAVGRGITPSRESSETVQKTTLPEPPLVEKINKSTVAGDKQQLEVEWSKGANDLIGAYVARIYLVGSGTLPNYESRVSPAVFSGLDPNREYVVQIRSQNAVGDYSVGATTQTHTLPAVPGAPQATTILSNFQLGISFEDPTQNPATTEYAVRLRAVSGFSGMPDGSAGKYAVLPGAEGKTTFSSDDPVWGRRSDWLGGSKLILTRLPDTFGYEVVLYARNDLKEEVGPGVGMAIAQSAGVPTVKLTLPTSEELTHLDSLNKAIYYNGMTVPLTAVGSSHFNVFWSSRTRTIKNNDMDQTYGWNGLLDVREDVVQADEDKFSKNDKAVGGFAVREEGEYFLNIAGTAMVDTGSGNLDVHECV
jgi:hypothetical protein